MTLSIKKNNHIEYIFEQVNKNEKELELDCSEIKYLTSLDLAFFSATWNRDPNINIKVSNANDTVKRVIRMSFGNKVEIIN